MPRWMSCTPSWSNRGSSSSRASIAASRIGHVGQPGRLGHAVRHVDAEPVDAAVQPEPQRLLEIVDDSGFVPVQVGLLGVEQVQVPLAGVAVRLLTRVQAGPPNTDYPVVRRLRAVRAASVAEDVALALRAARSLPPARPGTRGARGLVWLGTRSIVILMSLACAASISRSNAPMSPNSGSTSRGSATS